MAKLEELLGALSGARPGGWVYPRRPVVSRLAPPNPLPQEADAYPMIRIIPGRGSQLEGAGIAATRRLYRYGFHVDIHGVVAPDEDAIADTWRYRLREDIAQVLHEHCTLGGVAETLEFGGGRDRREDVDEGQIAPKAWFVLPFTVWLRQEYATAA